MPMQGGAVSDATRLKAALPTVLELADRRAIVLGALLYALGLDQEGIADAFYDTVTYRKEPDGWATCSPRSRSACPTSALRCACSAASVCPQVCRSRRPAATAFCRGAAAEWLR